MNHSARPNTDRVCDKKTGNLLIVARAALPAGVELTTTYGAEDTVASWGITPEN